MNKVFLALVVLAICVEAILAKHHGGRRGRGGKGGKGGKRPGGFLLKHACQWYNSSDPTAAPQTKRCGCAERGVDDPVIECEVQAQGSGFPLVDIFGYDLEASFCPLAEPQWDTRHPFRNVGIVGLACLIEIDGASEPALQRNCSRDGQSQCVTDVTTQVYHFTVNGTDARAYFCDHQLQQQEHPDHSPRRSHPRRSDGSSEEEDEGTDDEGPELLVNANDEPCAPLPSERRDRGSSSSSDDSSEGRSSSSDDSSEGRDGQGQQGQQQRQQQQQQGPPPRARGNGRPQRDRGAGAGEQQQGEGGRPPRDNGQPPRPRRRGR